MRKVLNGLFVVTLGIMIAPYVIYKAIEGGVWKGDDYDPRCTICQGEPPCECYECVKRMSGDGLP